MTDRPTSTRTQRNMKRAWDTTKVIGALATAAVAAFGWLEAREASKTATNDTAAAELKVDKAYSTLAEAVRQLAEDNRDQRRVIGDLREAVAELRGALEATRNTRANRVLRDSEALKALTAPEPEPEPEPEPAPPAPRVGSAGGGVARAPASVPSEKKAKRAFKGEAEMLLDLPEQIQVEQQAVEQYIQQKKAK